MLADVARVDTDRDPDNENNNEKVVHRELRSKEDILNYVKGII